MRSKPEPLMRAQEIVHWVKVPKREQPGRYYSLRRRMVELLRYRRMLHKELAAFDREIEKVGGWLDEYNRYGHYIEP